MAFEWHLNGLLNETVCVQIDHVTTKFNTVGAIYACETWVSHFGTDSRIYSFDRPKAVSTLRAMARTKQANLKARTPRSLKRALTIQSNREARSWIQNAPVLTTPIQSMIRPLIVAPPVPPKCMWKAEWTPPHVPDAADTVVRTLWTAENAA